jgi:hypothetical protein
VGSWFFYCVLGNPENKFYDNSSLLRDPNVYGSRFSTYIKRILRVPSYNYILLLFFLFRHIAT